VIQETRSKQLAKLAHASPKKLWAAVSKNKGDRKNSCYPSQFFSDIDAVNSFFASVCTDPLYSKQHVHCFVRKLSVSDVPEILLHDYEVARLLQRMKASSPGFDNIPSWFYRHCSCEIAHVVAHILNLTFSTGTVPQQWRSALFTPVPKVPKPVSLASYRPISVTPLLSRVAERHFVTKVTAYFQLLIMT